TTSINFAVRGLKRKQALLGSNLSAIDSSRYAVTDMGLRFLSPFFCMDKYIVQQSVTAFALWLRKPIQKKILTDNLQ
ncbi:hypothetical protein, partial [Bacteroides acidifaciens]|uniref:hypothetical protein n=1 Tax=Bacteroides acidifaciens TaxID=85831 RepID=UPI0025A4F29C